MSRVSHFSYGDAALSDMPSLPPITDPMMEIPPRSEVQNISTSGERLLITGFEPGDSVNFIYLYDNIQNKTSDNHGYISQYTQGGQADYILTLRQFFVPVPGSYCHIQSGDSFSKVYTISHGMSTSDTETISAELDASVDDIGAKISATFESTVTIDSESSEQTTYNVESPPEGYTRVWLLWQLVYSIAAIDKNGDVLIGWNAQGVADVPMTMGEDNQLMFLPLSMSFRYDSTEIIIPQSTVISQQVDFPTS